MRKSATGNLGVFVVFLISPWVSLVNLRIVQTLAKFTHFSSYCGAVTSPGAALLLFFSTKPHKQKKENGAG